jgi:hypothetical protein
MSTTKNNNNTFKLPICYDTLTCIVPEQIQTDLELVNCIIDCSGGPPISSSSDINQLSSNTSVYNTIFKYDTSSKNYHMKNVIKQIASTYTTNILYLKDTQNLITNFQSISTDISCNTITYNYNYDDIILFNHELQLPTFLNTYGLIEYQHFLMINNYKHILQVLSLYTICSPIIALATPIIILIIPFILLKIKFVNITLESYIELLKQVGHSNPCINMCTNFRNIPNEQKTYQAVTLLLYIYSIYQQCTQCYKFYTQLQILNSYLVNLKQFVSKSLSFMRHFVSYIYKLNTYSLFNTELSNNINTLLDIQHFLEPIQPFTHSMNTLFQIGYILKITYVLYSENHIQQSIQYALSFNAYYEIIESIVSLYQQQKIHIATFKSHKKPILKFKHMYYPPYIWNTSSNVVTNHINLQKNMVITGPNASGKTTLLKSVFINILLTQQFGVGCYTKASITPFKYLHCYLNIPDTIGRDSLFQAEARRCKEIIDLIQNNTDGHHLTIFDELYSGTNPDEAISSSYGVLKYITKYPHIKWILTTHFIELCKLLDTHKNIKNSHMEVNDQLHYTYLLKPKMSTIKGAHKILQDMNFPQEVFL